MTNSTDDAPSTELEATPGVETEAAPAVEAAPVATAAPVVTAAPRKKKLALIISGAVVAALLLFGGGVAVGTIIPTGGPGMSQGGPGGGFPGGDQGDRPTMPGQGTQQQDGTDTESN